MIDLHPAIKAWLVVAASAVLLSACGTSNKSKGGGYYGGGYYGGDAPPKETRDFQSIPDAVPRVEPLSKTGNKPYKALGKSYTPLKSSKGYQQTGTASWYGTKFHGRRTSSGETYDMWKMTAAHPTLPLPTYVRVTNLDTNKSIVVKVNDRGPFLHNRIIDLSYAAAHKLGIANKGTGRVKVVALDPKNNQGSQTSANVNLDETDFKPREGTIGGNIFVQIGAFSDPKNARSARARISFLGYAVYPVSESEQFQNAGPYRIQAGPFSDYDAALAAKSDLENRFGHDMLIIVQ